MRRPILTVFVILVTLLTGCATVPLATSSLNDVAKTFVPPHQRGRVYCYRPYNYVGCALTLPLEVDGQHVADLAPDTFAYFDLPAGVHEFSTFGSYISTAPVKINVQPENLYFLRWSVITGRYTHTNEVLAKKQIQRCSLVKLFFEPIETQLTEPIQNAPKLASGTGFTISSGGHILTAYHVVKDSDHIRVRFGNDEWQDATLVKHSRAFDAALLKVDTKQTSHLSLCDSNSIKQGQKVFTIGLPAPSILGTESKYTEGVISATTGVSDEASRLQVTVPVQPGNSGGALVASEGCVVGLITSTAAVSTFVEITGSLPQNVNWAVNADYLRVLLNGVEGIEQYDVVSKPSGTVDEIIAFVSKATCAVESRDKNVE